MRSRIIRLKTVTILKILANNQLDALLHVFIYLFQISGETERNGIWFLEDGDSCCKTGY